MNDVNPAATADGPQSDYLKTPGDLQGCCPSDPKGPAGPLGPMDEAPGDSCCASTPRAACSRNMQRLTDDLVYGIKQLKDALPDAKPKQVLSVVRELLANAFNKTEVEARREHSLRMGYLQRRTAESIGSMFNSLERLVEQAEDDEDDGETEGASPEEALTNEGGAEAPPADATNPENLDLPPSA